MTTAGPARVGYGCGGPLPLGATVLDVRGSSPVAAIARRHLVALGCRLAGRAGEPAPPLAEGPASSAAVTVRGGCAGSDPVECAINWATPFDAAVEDEMTAQAVVGIMHVHGRKSGAPERLGVPCASTAAGVLAVQGVLATVLSNLRGNSLRRADTSVARAGLVLVSPYLAAVADDGWTEPGPVGGPPFVSREGIRFEIEALEPMGWQRFWLRINVEEAALRRGWRSFFDRYATATCPLPAALHEAAAGATFAELHAAAVDCGISILRLRSPAERSAELVAQCRADGTVGPGPWRVQAMPGDLGASTQHSAATSDMPLAGITVVECTRRLQGPLAGRLLGLLGARVVRIEAPGGDPGRGSARFMAINGAKTVVEADLKSVAGRHAVRELVADADVFLHNWAPEKAAELALDAEHLVAVRPGLVYAYASGWGDALGRHPPPGTDFMIQAHSGLAAMVRPADEPPAPSLMTITDVLGGLVSAEGVLTGLLARTLTGAAQRVDSSLLSAATELQSPVLDTLTTSVAHGAQAGRPVWTPLDRPLETGDGWVALSDRARADPSRLAAACGMKRGNSMPAYASLVARFRQETSLAWVRRLHDAGLSCVPVCVDLRALVADAHARGVLDCAGTTSVRAPWEFSR